MSFLTPLYPMPLQHIESTVHGQYDSKAWAATGLMPYRDDTLKRLMRLRLMYVRLYHRYHMYRRRYWSHMPVRDQLQAEAQADYAESMAKDIYALECLRILEIEEFESQWEALKTMPIEQINVALTAVRAIRTADAQTDLASPAFQTSTHEMDRLRIRFGIVHQLLPRFSRLSLLETQNLFTGAQPELAKLNLAPNADTQSRAYAIHFDILSHIDHGFSLSCDRLNLEFIDAINTANQLKGQAGASRYLITNHDIPLPTIQTIDAWAHLCLLHMVRVQPSQWLVTFCPPFLPVTKDQRSGGQGIVEDGTAGHSLPGRSGGHDRTESGMIIPGQARVMTVRVDLKTKQIEYITGEYALDAEQKNQDYRHQLTLAPDWKGQTGVAGYWGLEGSDQFPASLTGSISDPWIRASGPLPLAWLQQGYPISTPWRHYAVISNLHLRFDSSDAGSAAIDEWASHFIASLIQRHNMSLKARLTNEFNIASALDDWAANRSLEIKRGGEKRRFDFSGLKMSPK